LIAPFEHGYFGNLGRTVNSLRLESRCRVGTVLVAVKAIGVKSVGLHIVNRSLVVTGRFRDESYNSFHIAKDPHLNP
jgi:hypothetical protein